MIKRFFTNVGVFLILLGVGGGYGAREFLSSHNEGISSTYRLANFFNEFGYYIAGIGIIFLILGLFKGR